MMDFLRSVRPRVDDPAPLPPHVVALIRERQRRLAAIRRYDRYSLQAEGHLALQAFWRNLTRQNLEDAQRLKSWLEEEIAGRS